MAAASGDCLASSLPASPQSELGLAQTAKSYPVVRSMSPSAEREFFPLDSVYCILNTKHMDNAFGQRIRERREALKETNRRYSLRQVAVRVGVQPGYLSRVERGDVPPPGEGTIKALAAALAEDEDVLLALAGRVSAELKAVIVKRPQLFAELLRQLRDAPDAAVLRLVREVRDGDW